ncbi:MAG: hypothetical protein PVH77_01250 [Phycisphaerales bacterium]
MSMDIVIKGIGIAFVLIGFVFIVRPDIMKWLMNFVKRGKRIYFAALLRFVLAVIFLLGASQCTHKWVIAAFGILFLLAGLLIFVLGPEKIRRILDWYDNQSLIIFRIIAVIPMAFGAVIIFSV